MRAEEAEEAEEREGRTIDNVNGRLSCYHKSKDGGEWEAIASFAITRIIAILTVEGDENQFYIVECTSKLQDDEELPVLRISYDQLYTDVCSNPKEGFSSVVKEVLVPASVANDNLLRSCFDNAFPSFFSHGLTLSKFSKHMEQLFAHEDCGPMKHTISYYGRQRSGVFVLANIAFQGGVLRSHEDVGISVLRHLFTSGKAALLPVQHHPKILIVPQDHVRYIFLLNLWNEYIPLHFTNNAIQTKLAVCLAVMHLQADKFWGGEACGPGMPVGWLFSSEGSTGKSRTQQLINALLGFPDTALIQGSMATKAAILGRLSQQSCLSVQLDEITTQHHRDHASSAKLKDAVHTCYQASEKACMATGTSLGKEGPPLQCPVRPCCP